MNKFVKSLSLTLLIGTVIGSLSSCRTLADMREHQAVFEDSRSSLIINDKRYRRLSTLREGYEWSFSDDFDNAYLTDDDVPVLLSPIFNNGLIFQYQNGEVYGLFEDSSEVYYCREDLYYRYEAEIDNDDCRHYYFDYYDESDNRNHRYVLSDEEQAMFEKVLDSSDPLTDDDSEMYLSVFRCYSFGVGNRAGCIVRQPIDFSSGFRFGESPFDLYVCHGDQKSIEFYVDIGEHRFVLPSESVAGFPALYELFIQYW